VTTNLQPIYLMVKTHSKTGLKYLCKTVKKKYEKYLGSGTRWTNHLNVHGNEHTTELIRICYSVDELIHWGRYYSELWNVVEERDKLGRKTWANLKPEEGQGYAHGKYNPMKNKVSKKKHLESINKPEIKEKQRTNLKKALATEESKTLRSEIQYEVSQRPEVQLARASYLASDEFKNKMSGENSPAKLPEVRKKRSDYMKTDKNPSKNPKIVKKRYHSESRLLDHKLYNFINDDGRNEFCTRIELFKKYPELSKSAICSVIKRTRNVHKGWRLTIDE
jgi:hypothetical protein